MAFSKSDINKIARMTDENFHNEARRFIAKKIKSSTTKGWDKLISEHEKKGFMNGELIDKSETLWIQLNRELRNKLSTKEYDKVVGAL